MFLRSFFMQRSKVIAKNVLGLFQISFKGGLDFRAKLQDRSLHLKCGFLEFTRKGNGYWKLDLPSVVCDVPGECDALCRLDR
jgi:hypothetical protein